MAADNGGDQRAGLWYGVTAYSLWGLFPLYWPLLEPLGAAEILAHRMAWSLIAVLAILAVLRRWSWVPVLLRQPRKLALVALAAAIISVNWGVYIWGVNSGHVVETSLGYFVNPLVTIAFGVLLLHERLRPVQWVAVGTGAAAVVVLTVGYGRLPWIALVLAFSFALYGLIKKKVGLGGLESLSVETAVMFLPAVGFIAVLAARGDGTFGTVSAGHTLLVMSSGIVTAIPLVAFGMAAVRVPLSVLGLLQYLAPVFQFVLGIVHFHEEMPAERWAGFLLVWLALSMLTWDALRVANRNRRLAASTRRAVARQRAEAAGRAAPEQPTATR
ncbi:EamA family transporter RarD [Streptomyces capparidis]